MAKFLCTGIQYHIEAEDVQDFEPVGIGVPQDEQIAEEIANIKASLPKVLVVEADDEEGVADAISDKTGWLVEGFQSQPIQGSQDTVIRFTGTLVLEGDLSMLDLDELKLYLEDAVLLDIDTETHGDYEDTLSVTGIGLDWDSLN